VNGMTMDGKLLFKARQSLREQKERNEAEHDRRYAEVYAKIPTVLTLERQLRRLISQTVAVALKTDNNPASTLAYIESESASLLAERAEILESNGFSPTYLDEVYSCEVCHDTGYTGTGAMCSCLKKLYEDERARQLSVLDQLGADSFMDFRLDYYDNTKPDAKIGLTPRQCMELVLNVSRRYAASFGAQSQNLLFRGGAGLGKTLICACIAKAVSAKGFSVVYDTACAVFEAFENRKFSKDLSAIDEANEKVRKIQSCDLFILDDLGTEMTTALTQSALYTILNTRLSQGKKTIICTGLSSSDATSRYSPQIVSRLEGEFEALLFIGEDIRVVKHLRQYRK